MIEWPQIGIEDDLIAASLYVRCYKNYHDSIEIKMKVFLTHALISL